LPFSTSLVWFGLSHHVYIWKILLGVSVKNVRKRQQEKISIHPGQKNIIGLLLKIKFLHISHIISNVNKFKYLKNYYDWYLRGGLVTRTIIAVL
jgi:hypothetical protein